MLFKDQPTRRDWLRNTAVGIAALASHSIQAAADTASGARLPHAKPDEIGLDPRRLQVAYDLLEKWTTGPNAPVPTAAILVGRAGKTVPPRYFGRQGPDASEGPVRRDGLFYLASVTKPVTFMAAMILVERGLLNLSDRVTRYIPEFAVQGKEETLVVHLFTHTSGLPDEPNTGDLRRQHAPLKKFIEDAVQSAPLFKAGTNFSYSSAGTVVVAEIVQRLSGSTIHQFVRREIIEPLELKSTGLGSQGFERERIVRTRVPDYQVGNDWNWNSVYWQEFGSPAGGLYSTPEDLAIIYQMLLDGGRRGHVRLLSPAAVEMMTTNRLDDLPNLPEPVRRTQPWGLGWALNHPGTPSTWSDLLGRHVFGHGGSAGNFVWIDPRRKAFCILLTNALLARERRRLVHLSNTVAAALV